MLHKIGIEMLDEMATYTIDTVMSGKQSAADNIHTIATYIEFCKMVTNRYHISDDEIPDVLCAKLDAIDYLLDRNVEKLKK